MTIQQRVTQEFLRLFAAKPDYIVRAPGRVNLIGGHTDYNGGFVLPMAIDRAVWIALRPRDDQRVAVHSLDFKETCEFDLSTVAALGERGEVEEGRGQRPPLQQTWAVYIKGVAWALQDAGYKLRGWEGIVAGDVPIGAGLSSSGALELATARAFAATTGFDWQPAVMAKLGQRAENLWVGVNCGIMDQMISASGKSGHALLIDCRSLDTKLVPLPRATVVAVLDTATRRSLADTAYNERRAQCEFAAKFFGVRALRDVSLRQIEAGAVELDETTRRRARHVICESERTLQAAEVMQRGDAEAMGRLMNQSHESLRDDFEVSSMELNVIVECAHAVAGCLGVRMTGAGFGGCAVALVRADAIDLFVRVVTDNYQKATGLDTQISVCQATNGAEQVH